MARGATRRGSSIGNSRARGGVLGALLKGLTVLLLLFLVVTALPVLLLRWLHPTTSAFMVEARVAAWRAGERGYHTDYQLGRASRRSPRRRPSR